MLFEFIQRDAKCSRHLGIGFSPSLWIANIDQGELLPGVHPFLEVINRDSLNIGNREAP